MKQLSRDEMKKVMGGVAQACTQNSDCGTNIVTCGGDPYIVNGTCNSAGSCRWVAVC